MTIKVKYSNTYQAKLARIKRLPVKTTKAVSGMIKRDLMEMRTIFHDGIMNDDLGLEKLADVTVKQKQRKGYPNPTSPLYGAGDNEGDRSYANMLIIVKKKNGWSLRPSTKKHWSGNITLKQLFDIHEHGATIRRRKKNGESVYIKIAPRPAFEISHGKWLVGRRKKETANAKEVKQAINIYINTGNDAQLKILQDYENRK